jgi:hypothetical protein
MIHFALITTTNRLHLFYKCLESIRRTSSDTKIFVVGDSPDLSTLDFIYNSRGIEGYIINKTNMGIAPSIDSGLRLIHNYYRFRLNEGLFPKDKPCYISYVQDDVEFLVNKWPEILFNISMDEIVSKKYKLGFLSGHWAPEHDNSEIDLLNIELNKKLITVRFRKHIRATHMMASIDFWMQQLPITVNDERGNPRGHPDNGRGSDVDWYFLRGHEKSVLKQNMVNLVIPGLLKHNGYAQSTWLSYILPEVG